MSSSIITCYYAMRYLILLLALQLNAQVVINHDVSHLNTLPSDWTIGNGCDSDRFIDVFVIGDLTLKADCYLYNAKLTVYGNVIYNGFTITYRCANDELIELDPLSITENVKESIRIYPNPSSNYIYSNIKEKHIFSIYDMNGKLVCESNDIRNLSTGLYIVMIQTIDTYYSTKLIKN